MWAGGEKQDCSKESGIWGQLGTKAREELEHGTRGTQKELCDCKESWSFARVRLLRF